MGGGGKYKSRGGEVGRGWEAGKIFELLERDGSDGQACHETEAVWLPKSRQRVTKSPLLRSLLDILR